MKLAANIVGGLLGVSFVLFSVIVLFNLAPQPPPPPEGSALAHFMTAFAGTGYLKFVKFFELLGGLLVAIPCTRRAGLLILGPILINILAFHAFITGGQDLFSPLLLVLVVMTLFLVWVERAAFKAFVLRQSTAKDGQQEAHLP